MQQLFTEFIPKGATRKGNIIITFRDEAVFHRMSKCLQRNGFAVYWCRSFQEFMAIEHLQFKCMVVDVTLGMASTFHAVETIKQSEVGKIIPILAVGDATSSDHVVRALNAGAADYILHPYTDAEFIHRLNALLDRPL